MLTPELLRDPAWMAGAAVSPDEAMLLYSLARATVAHVPDARVVESGTCRGVSALFLAAALPPGGTVHTFDPYDRGAQAFWDRWGARGIIYHRAPSTAVPEDLHDVHLCFFDAGDGVGGDDDGTGEHTEAYVLAEWDVWRSRVQSGGLVLWHDGTPGAGVSRAVQRICAEEPMRALHLPTANNLILGRWGHDYVFTPEHVRAMRVRSLRAAAAREQAQGHTAIAAQHDAAALAAEHGKD